MESVLVIRTMFVPPCFSFILEAHPCGGRRISSDVLLAAWLEVQAGKVGMTSIRHHMGYQPQEATTRVGEFTDQG